MQNDSRNGDNNLYLVFEIEYNKIDSCSQSFAPLLPVESIDLYF